MRKAIFPLAFVATSMLAACSFQMRAGSGANQPNQGTAAPPATTPRPAPAQTGTVRVLGKRPANQNKGPTPAPTSSSTTPAPTPTTPPSTGVAVVSSPTLFGDNAADATGFKGAIYWVDKNTTKVPPLTTMTPAGFLFTKQLNVTPQAFTTGFPGVDAARKENFAIHYEAPLVVTTEADYDFRLVAEDGAKLLIDNTPIVDNDGVKTAPAEKSGPVHLVAGTHLITVEYLQTTGNVALQLFCKKTGDAEKVCPTQL